MDVDPPCHTEVDTSRGSQRGTRTRSRGRGQRGRGQRGRGAIGRRVCTRGGSRGRGRAHAQVSNLKEYTNDGKRYLGKDQITEWEKNPIPVRGRTPARNIVTRLPGPKGQARNVKTPIESFSLFFPDEVIERIVIYTNQFIETIKDNFSRERDALPTDISEMKALLGLLFLAGLHKSSHVSVKDLWSTDGTGVEMFRCVMRSKRFQFLLRSLRFDDIDTRPQRLQFDKLGKIRVIFDDFVERCVRAYSPSEYVTVDEMLDAFRGKCPFRQYMPKKPAKYGIKMFALCCARTFYTVKLEVYTGKQPEGPFQQSNKVVDVVDRIVQPVVGTGRNVTVDNWFMSVPMANHLRDDHKLTVVGTIRSDKPELPLVFKSTSDLPVHSSMFAFQQKTTVVLYKPNKKKMSFCFRPCMNQIPSILPLVMLLNLKF